MSKFISIYFCHLPRFSFQSQYGGCRKFRENLGVAFSKQRNKRIKLRCTFAPSTALNATIQKTLSVLFGAFLPSRPSFSLPSFSLLNTPIQVGTHSRSFQLRGNNKRDKKGDTRSFGVSDIGGTRQRRGRISTTVVTFSACARELSVNNVYFPLPSCCFLFLPAGGKAPLSRKFNYAPHRRARACGSCFSSSSVFLFHNKSRENLYAAKFHSLRRRLNGN